MTNKIEVKKKDATVIKGTTSDFLPNKEMFHIQFTTASKTLSQKLLVNDLKAVFFVKKLEGNKDEHDIAKKSQKKSHKISGKHLTVFFHDGEIIEGTTNSLHLNKLGFFIAPVDIMDNNHRIFVVLSYVEKIVVEGETIKVSPKPKKQRQCLICRNKMEDKWKYCPFDGAKLIG